MKVAGSAVLHAGPDKVWAAINDPLVLAEVIPGCESLTEVGSSHYKGVVSMGIASIKGTYQGEIKLEDQQEPNSLTLKASGAGSAGTIDTSVAVLLKDLGDGTTEIEYDADAIVGGMVGGVGQRVLTSVAKKTAGAFFNQIDAVLTGKKPVGVKSAAGAAGSAGAAGAAGAAGSAVEVASGSAVAPVSAGMGGGIAAAAGLGAATAGGAGGFALGAVFGAVTMAVGVLIGSRITRRR